LCPNSDFNVWHNEGFMQWKGGAGHLWLIPALGEIPSPQNDPQKPGLGLEIHQPPDGPPPLAIANPDIEPLSQPYVAENKTAALELITELVAVTRTLHEQGVRIGFQSRDVRSLGLLTPTELVAVIRSLGGKPILHGVPDRWSFGEARVDYQVELERPF